MNNFLTNLKLWIYRHIKNHLKSFLIWDLSKRLSELEFKSDHSI